MNNYQETQPLASINPNAVIGKNVKIGPFVTIDDNVEIGDGCIIDSNAVRVLFIYLQIFMFTNSIIN